MDVIYQISVSNPWLVEDTRIVGSCYDSVDAAEEELARNGFRFFPDAGIWHNGRTEAWVIRRPFNSPQRLGREEVQLR